MALSSIGLHGARKSSSASRRPNRLPARCGAKNDRAVLSDNTIEELDVRTDGEQIFQFATGHEYEPTAGVT